MNINWLPIKEIKRSFGLMENKGVDCRGIYMERKKCTLIKQRKVEMQVGIKQGKVVQKWWCCMQLERSIGKGMHSSVAYQDLFTN